MPMNPRLLRPLASGFNPRQIAGLAIWLDAADSSTLTMNGSTVSQWRDKSATASMFSQGDAARQPLLTTLNGKTAIAINSDLLLGDAASKAVLRNVSGSTMLVVASSETAGFRVLLTATTGTSTTSGRHALVQSTNTEWSTGGRRLDADSFSTVDWPGFGTGSGGPHVISSVIDYSNADLFAYENGTLKNSNTSFQTPGSTSDTDSQAVAIGALTNETFFWVGRLGEVLIWPRVLTASERQRAEGYLAWKWGLQAQLPYNHPYAKSFPGYGSQALPTDPDALTYLAAVAAADGTGVEVGVANAVDDFVKGCKSDGTWDSIKASCILAGARTLAGALVPLKGTAPTNNNFTASDYNRETGLVGDGSTTYLDSNRANDADPQDDNHNAAYVSTVGTAVVVGSVAASGGNTMSDAATRNRNSSPALRSVTQAGFYGMSRSLSASYSVRVNGSTFTETIVSQSPSVTSVGVFALGTNQTHGDHRLAFYSIGESLDLAALDARVSALITAIGAAI